MACKKNRLSKIKKLTSDPWRLTLKEMETSELHFHPEPFGVILFMDALTWLSLFVSTHNTVGRLPVMAWIGPKKKGKVYIFMCLLCFLLQRNV